MSKPLKLIISLLIPQLAGGIGALFTTPSIQSWYTTINRPELNPPNWVFGLVWTALFILIGLAFYRVWTKEPRARRSAFIAFFVQLALNTTWSILFFGLHQIGAALVEIVILWIAIVANIILFYREDRWAGLLLIPYLLWVSFAIYLNAVIWILNR